MVQACHLIGVIEHPADSCIDSIQAHVRIFFVQYNCAGITESTAKLIGLLSRAIFRSVFFDIFELLLSIRIIHRRDLRKPLDQISQRRNIFCLSCYHISADQNSVRICITDLVCDHAVSAFKDISEEIGDHSKAERLFSFRFLCVKIVGLGIIVGAIDHPARRYSNDQSQYQ